MKLTGPVEQILYPYLGDEPTAPRNPLFADMIRAIAEGKAFKFRPNGSVVVNNVDDLSRMTINRIISLHDSSAGAIKITEVECYIGVPLAKWNDVCPIDTQNPQRTWAQLHESGAYTYREINSKNWVFYGAINPNGLSAEQLKTINLLAGYQIRSMAAYQNLLPPEPPL